MTSSRRRSPRAGAASRPCPGIPAPAGATPVQNVGAYGQRSPRSSPRSDLGPARPDRPHLLLHRLPLHLPTLVVQGERPLCRPGRLFQFVVGDLSAPVAYADLATQLDVPSVPASRFADARDAVLAQRRRRGMVLDPADHDTWSCGSFFTNPLLSESAYARLVARIQDRLGPEVTRRAIPPRTVRSRRVPRGSSSARASARVRCRAGRRGSPAGPPSRRSTPRPDQPRRRHGCRHSRPRPHHSRRGVCRLRGPSRQRARPPRHIL